MSVNVQHSGGELDDLCVVTPLEVTRSQVVEATHPQPPGLGLHLRGLSLGLEHFSHRDVILRRFWNT